MARVTTSKRSEQVDTGLVAQAAQQQGLALSPEQKDMLRRLYDRAEDEANRTDLSPTASYRRIGIAQGIERAAGMLGFDIIADWDERHGGRR